MKNKFALCFRPVVIESEEISDSSTGTTTAVSKDIMVAKVQKNNGTILPPSMSPSLLKHSGGDGVQVPPFPQPQNHSRKALSRVLKAILFETPPRMRIQGGNTRELTSIQEKTNTLEGWRAQVEKMEDHKRKREANIISEENKTIPSISSSSSSPTSSSIGICSSSSDQSSKDFQSLSMKRSLARSRSNTLLDDMQIKKAKITKTNHDKAMDSSSSSWEDKDMVLYWMVLALLATTFWGKIFATLLATLWLYFIAPYWRSFNGLHQRTKPENNSVRLPEIETISTNPSWELKKKVIMEGLLERKAVLPHTKH